MEGLVSSLGFSLGLGLHGRGWTSYREAWRQEKWRHAGRGSFSVIGSLSWGRKNQRSRRISKAPAIYLLEIGRPGGGRVASFEGVEPGSRIEAASSRSGETVATDRHLLCLSNGHGEDAIAVTILKELQSLAAEKGEALSIEGIPLVGLGSAYSRANIPLVGPKQTMPSGGFIYMDVRQLVGDLKAGLFSLFLQQWQAVTAWTDRHPGGVILAVGDVLPLAIAWLATKRRKREDCKDGHGQSNMSYAFVSTAKSEFYVRHSDGSMLGGDRLGLFNRLLYKDGVHFPWERALMADDNCRLVAPRDSLTAQVLQQGLPLSARSKVKDLGNPMMDGLQPTGVLEQVLASHSGARFLAILPGSRSPEVHENWNLLLHAASTVSSTLSTSGRRTVFVAPVVPSLPLAPFADALASLGWHHVTAPEVNGAATWQSLSTPAGIPEKAPQQQEQLRGAPPGIQDATWQQPLGTPESARPATAGGGGARSIRNHPPSLVNQKVSASVEDEVRKEVRGGIGQGVALQMFQLGKDCWGPGEGEKKSATPLLVLLSGGFADCIEVAEAGLAMAGTATEQMVGLGKPVFTLPGKGPQFTATFAEAQSRLLGQAVFFCEDVNALHMRVTEVLENQQLLAEVAQEGHQRMGEPGAGKKISSMTWRTFW